AAALYQGNLESIFHGTQGGSNSRRTSTHYQYVYFFSHRYLSTFFCNVFHNVSNWAIVFNYFSLKPRFSRSRRERACSVSVFFCSLFFFSLMKRRMLPPSNSRATANPPTRSLCSGVMKVIRPIITPTTTVDQAQS